MEFKFLDQDVDVVFLVNKGIVIGSLVGRNCNNILMETGKFMDMLTECLSRRILRLTTSPIDLIHSERVSNSASSFLAHCLACTSHVPMIISKFWCLKNETGSLNFGPLCKRSLSFSFRTIVRSPVTTWPHGAYRNSEPEQVQGKGFWERLLKSICCRLLL